MKYLNTQRLTHAILLSMVVFVAFCVGASAADSGGVFGNIDTEFTVERVLAIITGLVCWFARVVEVFLVLMITFYGVQMMWSKEPSAFGSAKKSFGWSLIGALVIFGVYSLIATVAYAVGADVGRTLFHC